MIQDKTVGSVCGIGVNRSGLTFQGTCVRSNSSINIKIPVIKTYIHPTILSNSL